jgi:hypothetical protein
MLFFFQNQEKKSEAAPVSEIAKPNILFLFADDQRADALGCSGNTFIRTPNIEKLAENGVRFTNSVEFRAVVIHPRMTLYGEKIEFTSN